MDGRARVFEKKHSPKQEFLFLALLPSWKLDVYVVVVVVGVAGARPREKRVRFGDSKARVAKYRPIVFCHSRFWVEKIKLFFLLRVQPDDVNSRPFFSLKHSKYFEIQLAGRAAAGKQNCHTAYEGTYTSSFSSSSSSV